MTAAVGAANETNPLMTETRIALKSQLDLFRKDLESRQGPRKIDFDPYVDTLKKAGGK